MWGNVGASDNHSYTDINTRDSLSVTIYGRGSVCTGTSVKPR